MFYKIRRKSDGLFSTGGMNPRFTKVGKTWNRKSHIKLHLSYDRIYTPNLMDKYKDCEVVEFETIERARLPFSEFMPEKH